MRHLTTLRPIALWAATVLLSALALASTPAATPAAAANTGTIAGTVYQADGRTPAAGVTVWLDFNRNGVQDAGEYGTKTDAQGRYTIGLLPNGCYPVNARAGGVPTDYWIGQPSYAGADLTLVAPAVPPTPVATPLSTPATPPAGTGPPATTSTAGYPLVPKLADNVTVTLAAGKAYAGQVVFNNRVGATLDGAGSTLAAPNDGTRDTDTAFATWYTDRGNTFRHLTITSTDGQSDACPIRGDHLTIQDVCLANLNEGLKGDGLTNLTIAGLRQTGPVSSRCLFLSGCDGLTWSDSQCGPATAESPIRFSLAASGKPGVSNATITNVTSTQVGGCGKAPWAIHSAARVTFNACKCLGGNFSLSGAGDAGSADAVADCTANDLLVVCGRIELTSAAQRCAFNRPTVAIDLDSAVNVGGDAGCVIDGGRFFARGGVKFYTGPSDLVVRNSTLYATDPAAPMFLGQFAARNDGGGNRVVVVSAAVYAAAVAGNVPATQPAAK